MRWCIRLHMPNDYLLYKSTRTLANWNSQKNISQWTGANSMRNTIKVLILANIRVDACEAKNCEDITHLFFTHTHTQAPKNGSSARECRSKECAIKMNRKHFVSLDLFRCFGVCDEGVFVNHKKAYVNLSYISTSIMSYDSLRSFSESEFISSLKF